jgi:site-specific recombinase XerD
MTTHPSLTKFTAFVQLKDFRGPTKKEYVRYVRRLGDHYQCDPAMLTEDQVRAYYLELRQVRKFGASAMKVAKCAFRAFFRDCLHREGWTVFEELRIAPPQTLPLVLTREQVATLLKALAQPRYRAVLGLICHTGLRVGEAVGKPAPTPAPRCPACGKPMFLLGTLPRAPTEGRQQVKA